MERIGSWDLDGAPLSIYPSIVDSGENSISNFDKRTTVNILGTETKI